MAFAAILLTAKEPGCAKTSFFFSPEVHDGPAAMIYSIHDQQVPPPLLFGFRDFVRSVVFLSGNSKKKRKEYERTVAIQKNSANMISHSQSAPVLQNLNQVAETPNSVIEDEASSCSVQVQAKEDSCADLAGDVADEAAAERTEAAALAAALEEMPSQVSVPGSLVASDELKQIIGDYATPEVLDTIPHAERVLPFSVI